MVNEISSQLLQASSASPEGGADAVGGAPEDSRGFARRHMRTGLLLYTQGRIEEALWEFFQAAADEPSDPLCHYLSGLALQALGLRDEARGEWRMVLTLTEQAKPAPPNDDLFEGAGERWPRRMASQLLERCAP